MSHYPARNVKNIPRNIPLSMPFHFLLACRNTFVLENYTCSPCPEREVCKKCTCPPPLKQKCNRTTDSGKELKQTDTCTDFSKYGIWGLIGAGIVLVLEISVIIGCKMAG